MNSKIVRNSLERIQTAVKAFDEEALIAAGKDFGDEELKKTDPARFNYWMGYVAYRLATFRLDEETRESEAREYIDTAVKFLENAVQADPKDDESYALLGTLTAMKIKLNVFSAMWLGPKSDGYYQTAEALNEQNPRLFYLKGIITLHKPGFVGGGARNAEREFQRAISLFETERATKTAEVLQPRWGYGECHYFMGQTCLKTGKIEEARGWFEKASQIDPGSILVKKALSEIALRQK